MNHITQLYLLLLLVVFAGSANAVPPQTLTISGAVNNPLAISATELDRFQSIDVHLNEITSNKDYHGSFIYHGVSLKTLLDVAGIVKKDTDFKKAVDLAVIVKSKSGESVALSWGEIYYKNPDNAMIAVSANPILPHHGIDHFIDKEAYHKMIQTLNRKIEFPKLVVTSDFYSDRCIENVTEIMVYDLKPTVPGKKSPSAYSEKLEVTGTTKNPLLLEKLDGFPHMDIRTHVVGEGRGYHGTKNFRGVPLKEIITAASPQMDLNTVFLVSAPDAYRVLLSYGELFFNPHGSRILVTDSCNGSPITENGKFILVLPDDLMADRELKATAKIEIIHIPK